MNYFSILNRQSANFVKSDSIRHLAHSISDIGYLPSCTDFHLNVFTYKLKNIQI